MYRVLLTPGHKAYACQCNNEMDFAEDFLDILQSFTNNGDIIILCEDLDDLKDAIGEIYDIEVVEE